MKGDGEGGSKKGWRGGGGGGVRGGEREGVRGKGLKEEEGREGGNEVREGKREH